MVSNSGRVVATATSTASVSILTPLLIVAQIALIIAFYAKVAFVVALPWFAFWLPALVLGAGLAITILIVIIIALVGLVAWVRS